MLLVATSCYRVDEVCAVRCDSSACPGELACGADLLCHAAGSLDCSQLGLDAPPMVDSTSDADTCTTSTLFAKVCHAAGSPVIELTGPIDTGGASACLAGTVDGLPACIVVGTNISVHDLTLTGDVPLVVIATGALSISGGVDAASHNDGNGIPLRRGPGTRATCGTQPGGGSAHGGGGAGGAYGDRAGNGGSGANGAVGGVGSGADATLALRGGCEGGAGGGSGASGPVGAGGGALFLLATSITIVSDARINASGAGGGNSFTLHGGAGGGAGGLIALEASTIAVDGASRVFAQGGGGAAGGPDTGTSTTTHGSDPINAGTLTLGGTDSNGGGLGGNGGVGVSGANDGGSGDQGGGGGGSVGLIVYHGSLTASSGVLTTVFFPTQQAR